MSGRGEGAGDVVNAVVAVVVAVENKGVGWAPNRMMGLLITAYIKDLEHDLRQRPRCSLVNVHDEQNLWQGSLPCGAGGPLLAVAEWPSVVGSTVSWRLTSDELQESNLTVLIQ